MTLKGGEGMDGGDSGDRQIDRASSAGTCEVWVRAAMQQELHDVGVAVAGGHHESREAVAGDFVRIGASVEESLNRLDLIRVNRVHEGCPAVVAGDCIGIGTLTDESADGDDVSSARCVGEGRETRVRPHAAAGEKNGDEGESHVGLLFVKYFATKSIGQPRSWRQRGSSATPARSAYR